MVTENFSDFTHLVGRSLSGDESTTAVVFVRKRDLAQGGSLAHHLAELLDGWAAKHGDPYPGVHWL